jgi:hypothetical protein
MAYADTNFPTKKAFKEAVASGKEVRLYNPSGMFPVTTNGTTSVEGPRYPKPHTWYAQVVVVDGIVTKVK